MRTKLWRACDEKHRVLWTSIPNCIIYAMFSGVYTFVEFKIILFICRMSYGFKRGVTSYLSLEDFAENTSISKSHLSNGIKSLISKVEIIRGDKKGNGYKYSINLAAHNVEMTDSRIGKGDYFLRGEGYELGNSEASLKVITGYNKNSYSNKGNAYINRDINNDIDNTKKYTSIQKEVKDYEATEKEVKLLKASFIEEIKKNNTADTVFKYMEKMREYPSRDPFEILYAYDGEFVVEAKINNICHRNEKNKKIFQEAQLKYCRKYFDKK